MSVYFSSYTNLLYVDWFCKPVSFCKSTILHWQSSWKRERLCKTCKTDHLSQKKLNPLPNPALFLNCLRCFQFVLLQEGCDLMILPQLWLSLAWNPDQVKCYPTFALITSFFSFIESFFSFYFILLSFFFIFVVVLPWLGSLAEHFLFSDVLDKTFLQQFLAITL